MTWFKVDDGFHSHRKTLVTKAAAIGLWTVAGSWSSANLTEGFIPDAVLPRLLPGAKRLAKDLVECGLWERVDNGFTFHDWIDYNPTAEEVNADREAARERMRKLRARRRQDGPSSAETDGPRELEPPERSREHTANVRENFGRSSGGSSEEVRNPVPSRPVPVPSANTSSQSSDGPYRVGQTDDDFDRLDEMITRLLGPLTAERITRDHAAWVRRTILDKGKGNVRNPQAYIRRTLQQDSRPYLPGAPTTTAASRTSAGRCPIHHTEEPCRGCAADRKARKDEA
ncbi:hypothetical protein AB0B45_02530 [Nonomuraea sp. NPDC049152]|uniref:hypothetical protein n=1 Tax=Nonomuraea sp. NPDC049152 TaxID=3154350 RepID=UPI0033EC73CF